MEQQVIPVEIAVTNRSRDTVYFSRSDVSLVSGTSAVAALPLDRLRRIDDLETSVGLEPGVAAEEDGGDLGYYATGTGRVRERPPSDQAVHASIPEGPIESGNERRGFVFFDDPPENFDTVALRVVLRRGPEPDAPVAATVDLPFVVER